MIVSESDIELSIVMPCLNEAETLAVCIAKARSFLARSGVVGEVVIADNGSTDGSQAIAEREGARVVHVPVRGYGAALQAGIAGARGRYVIMGDADDSYDFSKLDAFVEKLRGGHDLVMGNRFRGGIAPGAMPFLHRYLGNPVLTTIGRVFFGSPARDFHCGLRGFRREAILALDLRTTGMEYASEMVVKASLSELRVTEVPTTLSPDGRSRPPHLRTWRDGWRHLRFLLLYSPRFLFFYPGATLLLVSTAVFAWLLPGPVVFRGFGLDVHTLLFASAGIQLGLLSMYFWWFARTFASSAGLLPDSARASRLQRLFTLERGLIVGGAVFGVGLWLAAEAVFSWKAKNFGGLDYQITLRVVIPAVTAMVSGTLIALGSFLVSLLTLGRR
ncbi:glycosyltransferase family 2 protein [Gemmatimonas sp.]|uniref:glycosyltransferase family 2 protein n=1 Tax=Gemmatimonas sp. TaxID=1962908 RepID=UPI0031F3266F